MPSGAYDENKVIREYVTHNFASLMTDLERRAYDLAIKREKAKHSDVAATRLPAWISAAGKDAAILSEQGLRAVAEQLRQRIQRDIWSGKILINRCPECSRIVKTPLAQQCLWCGHDWHSGDT